MINIDVFSFFQMFIFVLFWYQLFNGFSGQCMLDQFYLILFNVVFTSLPPLITGIFDRDVSEEMLLAEPRLYKQGSENTVSQQYIVYAVLEISGCREPRAPLNSPGAPLNFCRELKNVLVSIHNASRLFLKMQLGSPKKTLNFEAWYSFKFCFTALLEGICATLNLRIQALRLHRYKAGYLFEGCYFGAIMGSLRIVKIKCL